MNTLEEIRSRVYTPEEVPPLTPELAHLEKLCTHAGIRTQEYNDWYRREYEYKEYQPYIEAGFRFFITASQVANLRYSASLNRKERYFTPGTKNNKEYEGTMVQDEKLSSLIYSGDIPDFALDRLAQFDAINRQPNSMYGYTGRGVTIHSNLPLPFHAEAAVLREVRKVDPVMVGWLRSPRFLFTHGMTSLFSPASEGVGVVLAVWDNDKELEI